MGHLGLTLTLPSLSQPTPLSFTSPGPLGLPPRSPALVSVAVFSSIHVSRGTETGSWTTVRHPPKVLLNGGGGPPCSKSNDHKISFDAFPVNVLISLVSVDNGPVEIG